MINRWQHRYWSSFVSGTTVAFAALGMHLLQQKNVAFWLLIVAIGLVLGSLMTALFEMFKDRKHPLARLEKILKSKFKVDALYAASRIGDENGVIFLPFGNTLFSDSSQDGTFARSDLLLHPDALPKEFIILVRIGGTDHIFWSCKTQPVIAPAAKTVPCVQVTVHGYIDWSPLH